MQLLKHVANAMQGAEGFVLERALVLMVIVCYRFTPEVVGHDFRGLCLHIMYCFAD